MKRCLKCLYPPPVLRLFFPFNPPCQFTPLLHLRSHTFGSKPFGSLRFVTVTPYFSWKHHFRFTIFITQINMPNGMCNKYRLCVTAFICLISNTTRQKRKKKIKLFFNYAHFYRDATQLGLLADQPGVLISLGARDFSHLRNVQTASGADQTSYSVATGALYQGIKRPAA